MQIITASQTVWPQNAVPLRPFTPFNWGKRTSAVSRAPLSDWDMTEGSEIPMSWTSMLAQLYASEECGRKCLECQCRTPLSHHTPHAVTSLRFRLMSLHLCLCQQRYSWTTADSIYSTMPFLSTPSLICHRWDWMALFQNQLSWLTVYCLQRQHPT